MAHRRWRTWGLCCASIALGSVLRVGSAAAGPLPRVILSLPPGADLAELARVIEASPGLDAGIVLPPTYVGIGATTQGGDHEALALPAFPTAVELRLHVVLDIGPVGGETSRDRESAVERQLREALDRLAARDRRVRGAVVEVRNAGASPEMLQFTIATLVVMMRASVPGVHVSLSLPPALADGEPDRTRRLFAYADGVVGTFGLTGQTPAPAAAAGRPSIARLGRGSSAGTQGAASRSLLEFLLSSPVPSPETVWFDELAAEDLPRLVTTLRFLNRALAGGFEMTPAPRAPVAVAVDGKPPEAAVAFLGSRTADVWLLLKTGGPGPAPRRIAIVGGEATGRPTCYDATDGRELPVDAPAGGCNADGDYVLVRVARAGSDDRLFESVNVRGAAALQVEEIIARWQAARHAERRFLENYSVPVLLGLHFEAGGTLGVAFDVALELRHFADASGVREWVQEGAFVNGVRFRRGTEFPLPLLEPDKVVARPLELSLEEKYVYELVGTEILDDTPCYVVAIQPAAAGETLYAGRVWIDGVGFRQVRLQLEQRTGTNNVAAHLETQEFARVRDREGREFMLLRSIRAQDTINLAGRSVIVEKAYRFGDYAINAADFQATLDAARSSSDPMYKDTEEGLQSFRKQGQARVVVPMSGKKVGSLVGGTMYDGSLPFPVPLAGLSWIDFKFRGTDAQMSVFFAGVFLNMNLSRQWNKALRTGIDAQVSALPSTDRVFSGSREIEGQQVRSFEQWTSGRIDWSASAGWNLTAAANASLFTYQATSKTDPAFAPPPNALTLSASGEAKYTRRGFVLDATVEQAVRPGGGAYGFAAVTTRPSTAGAFRRYSGEIGQHLFVGKLTRGGLSARYYGGDHLDRFARYKPSLMSRPKIRGIPSGTESFDEVALAEAYYGFNVLDLIKLEGTFNHAWGRNRSESNAFRQFDVVDMNAGIAGPWSTYLQASVGVVLRGNLERYRSRWDTYILIFKPFKR